MVVASAVLLKKPPQYRLFRALLVVLHVVDEPVMVKNIIRVR